MRRRDRESGHHMRVDLTPMIDVVFQLIIFFMLTSHLGDLRRTEIDLPREEGTAQREDRQAAMIIDIGLDGVYYVESRPTTITEIHRLAVSGLASGGSGEIFDVLIRPDQNAPAAYLDRLLSSLTDAGVTRWKMGTYAPLGGG